MLPRAVTRVGLLASFDSPSTKHHEIDKYSTVLSTVFNNNVKHKPQASHHPKHRNCRCFNPEYAKRDITTLVWQPVRRRTSCPRFLPLTTVLSYRCAISTRSNSSAMNQL